MPVHAWQEGLAVDARDDSLAAIRRQIDSGAFDAAKRALVARLTANPHHIDAWLLLATLLDDPQQQADCYRQVLSLDPGHGAASRALAQFTTPMEGVVLRCPQCGGAMEIYFAEERHDKRARCSYCATDVDLPDSFRQVRRVQTSEQRAGVQRFEDALIVESRSDGDTSTLTTEDIVRLMQAQDREVFGAQGTAHRPDYAYTKDDLRQLLAEHGLSVTDEKLDDFMRRYVLREREQTGPGHHVVVRRVETRRTLGEAFSQTEEEPQGCLSLLLRLFGEVRIVFQRSRPAPSATTDVQTMIKTAGGPLPPHERQRCPHCGATLSKRATRCVWCGARLNDQQV